MKKLGKLITWVLLVSLLCTSAAGVTFGEEEHSHTETCYAAAGDLLCGLEENEEHVHSEVCYAKGGEQICDMEAKEMQEEDLATISDASSEDDAIAEISSQDVQAIESQPAAMRVAAEDKQDIDAGDVASVDGQGYETLKEAYEAAQKSENNTVVLQADIEEMYLLIENKLILDMNGHTINAADSYPAFYVGSSGDLTLKGAGTINGGNYDYGIIVNTGKVTLTDNVVLQGNTGKWGGAVYLANGIFDMNGGTIQNTSTNWYGGAIYLNGGVFNMNGGVIQNTEAKYAGGGVYLGSGTFVLSGGAINSCCTKTESSSYSCGGGGVYIAENAAFQMKGGDIVDNEAVKFGGGVCNKGDFFMSSGYLMKNRVSDSTYRMTFGGGVCNKSRFEMSGGIITQNRGDGGIYSADKGTEFNMTGGAVFNNESDNTISNYDPSADIILRAENKNDHAVKAAYMKASVGIFEYTFKTWRLYEAVWDKNAKKYNAYTTDLTEEIPPENYKCGGTYKSYTAVLDDSCIEDAQGIYLDGQNGDDGRDGKTSGAAVKTFDRAKALANDMMKENQKEPVVIFICGKVTISAESEWALPENVILKRADSYQGYLIDINADAGLKLTDITIDGGGKAYPSTRSLIHVNKNASLYIGDDTVLQNNKANITGQYDGGAVFSEGGTVEMSGGIIRCNESRKLGGGISVSEGGSFKMIGGEISNNTSVHGGGICAVRGAKIEISDGIISGNKAVNGGGINLGAGTTAEAVNSSSQKQKLVMTGGSVSKNQASACGGGIFIQMNSEAEITGGDIVENIAEGGPSGTNAFSTHSGGGIYVNGGKQDSISNGELHLYNAEITHNQAKSAGGGLGACPTADVKVYVEDGAIFYQNTTGSLSPEAEEILVNESTADHETYISDFMLGGGMYQWIWSDGSEEKARAEQSSYQYTKKAVYLDNICHEDDIKTASDMAQVHIKGNKATSGYGGGIGANGTVIIGTGSTEHSSKIQILKLWDDDNDKNAARPESVTVDIKYGDYTLRGITLTAENQWTATIENMPEEILKQENPELGILEIKCPDYAMIEDSCKAELIDGILQISFTNKYDPTTGKLKISKQVTGSASDSNVSFTFDVTLKDKDGSPLTSTYDYTGSRGSGKIKSGDSITLKNGEYILISGIPEGASYMVTEREANQNGYLTIPAGDKGIIVAGNVMEAIFVNYRDGGHVTPVSVSVVLEAKKTLDGKIPLGASFTFSLRDENGKLLMTAKNDGGRITFGRLYFDKEGTYIYTLTEEQNSDGKISYDTSVYRVIVKVNKDDSGRYKADVTYEKNGKPYTGVPLFENTAKDDKLISVGVKKVWDDDNNPERPESVKVQLYRNGEAYGKEVVLNSSNGWQYSWNGLDEGATWEVKESSQLGEYTSTTTCEGNQWIITNHLNDTPEKPDKPDKPENPGQPDTSDGSDNPGGGPETGDTAPLMGWSLLLAATLAVLAVVMKLMRRKYSRK